MTTPTIWTIGHSTRTAEAFAAAVEAFPVSALADVRRAPHSRRHPWFNVDPLRKTLFRAQVRYVDFGDDLGNVRSVARIDSPHKALGGSPFQAYADHMGSARFERGYHRLRALATQSPTVIMCAERSPRKCHRRLLSDKLASDGWRVVHILDADDVRDHVVAKAARVSDDGLVYDAAEPVDA